MRIIYPQHDHHTYEDSTFIIGSVPVGQGIRINGEPVNVTTAGSFAHKIDLRPGSNAIVTEAVTLTDNRTLDEFIVVVNHHPPYQVLPDKPLQVLEDTMVPNDALIVKPGDWVHISCLATPGCRATITLPGVMDEAMPLMAMPGEGYIDNREAVFARLHQTRRKLPKQGFYQGALQIPRGAPPCEITPLMLRLEHPDGETINKAFPGGISVLHHPRGAKVSTPNAVTRTAPEHGARLTPLPVGTHLLLNGAAGSWCRVRMSSGRSFWISAQDIELFPASGDAVWMPEAFIHMMQVQSINPHKAKVVIPLTDQLPLDISSRADQLTVQLFGATSRCDFVQYPGEPTIVRDVRCVQTLDDVTQIEIAVDGLAGYDFCYSDIGLEITVKTLPKTLQDTVVLIDPGHGGEETGATGPSGVFEKDLNLQLAFKLKHVMDAMGFDVHMTRMGDDTVSLDSRTQQVKDREADIMVSLHHNALPDGRDPLQEQGLSCYFYHAFSRQLAQTVQTDMVHALNCPDYGVFYDSLHVLRLTQALAVMVEVGFMTHPEEFDKLCSEAYQDAVVSALSRSILAYCVQTNAVDAIIA